MKGLARAFFARDALDVAPDLIGRNLYRETDNGLSVGRIVETEAYRGADDPGSHAYRGMTPRNQVMFGPPGHLYIYFTYGMHFCVNVVTGKEGIASAVLLRAVEPTEGLDSMAQRRGTHVIRNLTRGPARLAQAFALGRAQNGLDLMSGPVQIGGRARRGEVITSPRIGLRPGMDQPWRFFEPGPWTSR